MTTKTALPPYTNYKEKIMRILVIDDTQKHLDSALQTLGEHEVITCSTYDEAEDLLTDYDYAKDCLKNKWDVVFCDLLMPAGSRAQGQGKIFVGQEMPVGWALALLAARNNIGLIAVVTDMNHHHHPASAMLDHTNDHIFKIDGSKVLMTNNSGRVGIRGTECSCKECCGEGTKSRVDGSTYICVYCYGRTVYREYGKNWGRILEKLTNNETEE